MLSYLVSVLFSWGKIFLYFVGTVTVSAYFYFRYSHEGRLFAKIPGPKGLPIVGNMFSLYGSPESLFNKLKNWHKSCGNIYKLTGFHVRALLIFDPDDIEVVLSSSQHTKKHVPYSFLYNWLGGGLLVSDGEKWKQRRKMLTPAFHFSILTKFINIICRNTHQFLDTIESHVGEVQTDIIPLVHKFTLQIMCETSMGVNISKETNLAKKYLQGIHKIGECIVERLMSPWLFEQFAYVLTPIYMKERLVWKDLHDFTKHVIQERRRIFNNNNIKTNDKRSKPIMLDLLFEEERKGNIDKDGIQEEVDTFLFEGHDTSASAIIFLIMCLANERDAQTSIFKELQDIFGNSEREPTADDLNKMKYLECCIKESLRLYPSVPFMSRLITEELTMSGYRVPKNTFYDIYPFEIHRNPDIYPDPEKFVPERFLPENAANRHPFAYIPFSAGPRNCIGQKFAIMQLKIMMSGLLRKYRLEPVTRREDLVFVSDLILRVSHPIYVRFCHRIQSLTHVEWPSSI